MSDDDVRGRTVSRRRMLAWAAGSTGLALTGLAAGPAAAAAPEATVVVPVAAAKALPAVALHVRDVVGKARRTRVALTIDDGPHPTWTPQVLDVLAEYGIPATFMMIGENAAAYPKLVRRVVRAGHSVGNHSMTHPQPFSGRSAAAIRKQITDAQRAITKAGGVEPELFRAPGGDFAASVLAEVSDVGLTPLGWSLDPGDWLRPGTEVVTRRIRAAGTGDIVLCHDGGGDRSQTVAALEAVLPKLTDVDGLRFTAL